MELEIPEKFWEMCSRDLAVDVPFAKVLALCMKKDLTLPPMQAKYFENMIEQYHESAENPFYLPMSVDLPVWLRRVGRPPGFVRELVDSLLVHSV